LEIELVFRGNENSAESGLEIVSNSIRDAGGSIVSAARIAEIAYQAILAQLPVTAVRSIIELNQNGIAGLDPVQHIRPQSLVASSELGDASSIENVPELMPTPAPILALIDGVPVSQHPLLANHVSVDDIFGLEPNTTLPSRRHGTSMASLIIHGDRNNQETPLPRTIHTIPVLGEGDRFPTDRLIIDLIYQAVISMKIGDEPTAPHVIIVNISLGNLRRPFHGLLSPWARLLDRLAYQFGILFMVSAGNITEEFEVSKFANSTAFEDADSDSRATNIISAIDNLKAQRRIISPAETVNGLTIGASNTDWVPDADKRTAAVNIDPFWGFRTANPSSALGPGFANSVKPDFLLPGGRELLRVTSSDGQSISVSPPSMATRAAGLKVAAPSLQGIGPTEAYTNGTSAATAISSRTAHRIHDALEAEYGAEFLALSNVERAVLLKALLVHPASWPENTAAKIKETVGPADGKQHVKQKDNIKRFLGFGTFEPEDAIACASDRATFWAVGSLGPEQNVSISVPVPHAYGQKTQFHSISATLAWFTPINPGRQGYRAVRLKLLEPTESGAMGVEAKNSPQPDQNQMSRGTVSTRCWSGEKAAAVSENTEFSIVVERSPDTGTPIDAPVFFAVAVTLNMPGVLEIYDQVRARLQPTVAPRP